MGDHLQFEAEQPPWCPTEESELVREYDRYGVPLVGVIEQEGNLFFFWNLHGGDRAERFWVYALVDPLEMEDLDRLSGPDQFLHEARRILGSRPATVALSLDSASDGSDGRDEIVLTVFIREHGDFDELTAMALEAIRDRVDDVNEAHRGLALT